MSFSLSHAPVTFEYYINDTLVDFLDIFCIAFIDNILICSDTRKEYLKQIQQDMERLKGADLFPESSKCQLRIQEKKFLGHIIKPRSIKMDPVKVSAVQDWPTTESVMDIQGFSGLANFY